MVSSSTETANTLVEYEKGAKIRVVEGSGINLQMDAKVEYNPDDIYKVLIDPEAKNVFRSIQACLNRQILENDKKHKRRKIQVTHRAVSKFLFLNITFETNLYVWEDDIARTIRFETAKPGVMKKFEGCWHVRPFTQKSLDEALHINQPTSPNSNMPSWMNPAAVLAAAQRMLPQQQMSTSLVSLEQHILANGTPPAPVRALIKRMVSKQLKDMMEDLRDELDRRNQGIMTGRPDKRKKAAASKQASVSSAASITHNTQAVFLQDLWSHCEPLIDITIRL